MIVRTKIPKHASGIYQIQSDITKKRYIGSAVNIKSRMRMHFRLIELLKHDNLHIQRHCNKYSVEDLYFGIIEICPKENLIEREQYWMNTLNPEFNICKIAGSCLGVKRTKKTRWRLILALKGKIVSIETRKKMSDRMKSQSGKDTPHYGCHLSKEAREKISKGNKGKIITKEVRERISKSLSGPNHPNYGKHRSIIIIENKIDKTKTTKYVWI